VKYLVIGGCGFIGSNLSSSLIKGGHEVTVFDNLSRKGTPHNLEWLKTQGKFKFVNGDVRNYEQLTENIDDIDGIFHLAAQVAVTTSIDNPANDFEINARGTFNVLEAIRRSKGNPFLLATSTNKVYGGLEGIKVAEEDNRYTFPEMRGGVSESQPLDFHSPYGCSKGTADQYVRDYARIYSLSSVVFRMSCIYGTRQFGNEDQGWVAHFIISHFLKRNISIYGDGKQIRDILFIDDLVEAFNKATSNITKTKGQIYNIGGGPANTASLLELLAHLEKISGYRSSFSFHDWRAGDQKVYFSDITKAKKDFGWEPKISKHEGVRRLSEWVKQNLSILHS
jgi:CDP-paratose 2-epimerase